MGRRMKGFHDIVDKDMGSIQHILNADAQTQSINVETGEYIFFEGTLYFYWNAGDAAVTYQDAHIFRCIP